MSKVCAFAEFTSISAIYNRRNEHVIFNEVDKKWQKKWEETELYKFDKEKLDKKLYCLEMFSYPSGANLHLGHWYNYGLTDSWARMKRLQGYNVFHPMGFDAFGLPAENYAIKTGIHPKAPPIVISEQWTA